MGSVQDMLWGKQAYEKSAKQIPTEINTIAHIQQQASDGETEAQLSIQRALTLSVNQEDSSGASHRQQFPDKSIT